MAASAREQRAPIDYLRTLGWVVNAALRLAILYFTAEVLLNPDDPRFEGKNLGARNVMIVLVLSQVFPVFQLLFKRWQQYPVWYDALYLSMYVSDMLGNSLNLFETYQNFDLMPHFHGPGALAVALAGAFGFGTWGAIGAANLYHALLEAQEWLADALTGSKNVRGVWDSVRDLVVGVVGSVVYPFLWRALKAPPAEQRRPG